ncbi:hypothetical protein, partial [Halodesulfurarchaeum sp.]|uniref:hypothetical protein n=1 Tax=Halodesulfurarchaeum sp. TaxID=1980530 RepID=UPI002FC3BD63
FSSVSAGRGVSVSAVSDPYGLLGIENVDSLEDPVFTNRTTLEMAVTLEDADVDTITFDGESSPYEFSLAPDKSKDVLIESEGDGDSALVDITADLDKGAGQITLQRDFSVPQAESVKLTGEVDATGASGQFDFEMSLKEGSQDVTFDGIKVNATTTEADEVSNNNATLKGDNKDLVTSTIKVDSEFSDQDTKQNFVNTLTLSDSQNSAIFEFDKFQNSTSSGNSGIDMRDQGVRITMYFGDDSSKQFDLCATEPCNF